MKVESELFGFNMMMKSLKNMAAFFLWLAFLVIIAHSIIPHDHNLNDTFSFRENICHDSNGKTGHGSGFPNHCHAFNDFASEEVIKYLLTNGIQFADISINSFSDAFKLQVCCIKVFDLRNTFHDSSLLESTSLRAPPLLLMLS